MLHRFIPASAGNTPRRPRPPATAPVHPRVCGEHIRRDGSGNLGQRFIPASAGNTPDLSREPNARWLGGSSPRLRGTRCRSSTCRSPSRFIPASAGNTPQPCPGRSGGRQRFIPASAGNTNDTTRSALVFRPVHPRVCGEHLFLIHPRYLRDPVHPRVCGEHLVDRHAPGSPRRFIPASAGNTLVGTKYGLSAAPVHPRVCGEHLAHTAGAATVRGSSPRLRGTHDRRRTV